MATKGHNRAESGWSTGSMIDELYQLYLGMMRRIGHYRWFSLFMKHVGSRIDRALIQASGGRISMSGPRAAHDATHHDRQTKAAKSERSRCITCATARIWSPHAKTSSYTQLPIVRRTCLPTRPHASRSAAPLQIIVPDPPPHQRSPATCHCSSRCGRRTTPTFNEAARAT